MNGAATVVGQPSGTPTVIGRATTSSPTSTFSPDQVPNLGAWWSADVGTITDGASLFTASNSQYLEAPNDPSLQAGGSDLTVAGWVFLNSKSATRCLIAKYNSGAAGEYMLRFNQVNDRFEFVASDGSSSFLVQAVSTITSPSTGVWYFIAAGKSGASIYISVNGGAADTTAMANPIASTTDKLRIGARNPASTLDPHDGRLDSVGIWKRALSSTERTALYNGGAGVTYASLPVGLSTNLSSWYDLDERTGTRYDSIGANHLTGVSNNIVDASTANGGFETAGSGGADAFGTWSEFTSGTSSVNRDTSVFRSGAASCRFDVDASNSNTNVGVSSITAGTVYYLSFYARSNQTSGGKVGAKSADYSQLYLQSATLSNSGWTFVSGSFTAKDTNIFITPDPGPNNGFSIYIDDVVLTTNGPTWSVGVTSGTATDGDPVKQWTDITANGRHATQTSLAIKPTYRASQVGGKGAISFDGVDDQLATANYNYPADITYIAVASQDNGGSGGHIVGKISGGANASALAFNTSFGALAYGSPTSSTTSQDTSGNAYVAGTFAVLSAVIAGSTSTLEAFVNGVSNGSTSGANLAPTGLPIFIGSRGAGNYLNGRIAEILLFERALSGSERQQVERYLGSKYGIAVA